MTKTQKRKQRRNSYKNDFRLLDRKTIKKAVKNTTFFVRQLISNIPTNHAQYWTAPS